MAETKKSEIHKYLISATIITEAQVVVEADSLGAAVGIAEKLPASHFLANHEHVQIDACYPVGENAKDD